MNKKNVLVMFGGKSAEYEVSLSSAYSILQNIDTDKYNVLTLGITKDGKWLYYTGDNEKIKNGSWFESDTAPAMLVPDSGCKKLLITAPVMQYIHVDVVFPVMHGDFCEDGKLQGLLEICAIPYVGPGCLSSAVAMDKVFTKLVLSNFDIPQADYLYFDASEIKDEACIGKIEKKFAYPIFIKPANAGSSVGTGKACCRSELAAALSNAAAYDSKIIAEEYIKGKEIEVAVMGNGGSLKVTHCGEISPGSDYYDYDTKYKTDTSRAYIPAGIPDDTAEKVREYAGKIYRILGCRGLSRVDFFVCDSGRIVFNEINTLPGFTTISMYPKLFMYEKMTYSEIIDNLIELALESK